VTGRLVDKQHTSRVNGWIRSNTSPATDNEMAWWIRSMLTANSVGETTPLKAVNLVHKQHINGCLCGA